MKLRELGVMKLRELGVQVRVPGGIE